MITKKVQLYSVEENWLPIPGEFWYDEDDPCAVALDVYEPGFDDEPNTWIFARSLLSDGAYSLRTTGIGDVRISHETKTLLDGMHECFIIFTFVSIADDNTELIVHIAVLYISVLEFIHATTKFIPPHCEKSIIARQIDSFLSSITSQAS